MSNSLTPEQKQLVEDNWLLVRFVIKKYYNDGKNYPIERDDLEQIGYLGLCNAAKWFDQTKGKFSTYAIPAIRAQIRNALRDLNALKRQGELFTVSIYQEYDAGKEDPIALIDTIPDQGLSVEKSATVRRIMDYMNSESDKDPTAAVLTACLTGQITQREAAQKIGVSQPQVCRLLDVYKQHIREVIGE